jgi:Zn-dependent protease with chaperone function
MTDAGVPSPRPTTILTDIQAASWEHPADRAALQTLRAIPGVDDVIRKVLGFFGERGFRLIFQANAVRVGPNQFPDLDRMLTEVCETLDWDKRPELFVTQTPMVNAGAVGVDEPFIVLNSGALSVLTDDQIKVIIGHELGHIMSDHMLYRTIMLVIMMFGLRNLPFLAGIALMPIQLALLEWSRKSELSCDRAGMLSTQDRDASLSTFLKLAGGGSTEETSLDEFLVQAHEYESEGGPLDAVYKIINHMTLDHPFNTLRAAELDRWIEGGAYEDIIGGDYRRRDDVETEKPITEDVAEGAGFYANEAKEVVGQVADAAKKAAQSITDAFRNP